MAVKEVTVRLRTPHQQQLAFVDCPAKRIIVRAGRRSGKTTGVAIRMVKRFLEGRRQSYGVPTAEQLTKCWYEVSKALEEPIAAGIFKKNETEHIIEKQGTEQRIKLRTVWNADTMRGDWGDDLYYDEWQLSDEDAWEIVGFPMMMDHNGDAVFIYTPPSLRSAGVSKAHDPRHAAKMFKAAGEDSTGRWARFHFTSFDNPYLSKEGLTEASKDSSRAAYRQEILAEDDELSASHLVYGAWNDDHKCRRFEIPASWPVYSGHDFGCVDEETDILTKRGWKRHNDILDDEVVLTLNPDTGQAEWQTIISMNRYQGTFPMRFIEQRGHNSLTTENHRWLVQKRKSNKLIFETSETLKVNDNVNCAAPCSNLPSQPIYHDSFVELVAWFWTEGQIDTGGVSIWQNEGEKAEQIRRCLLAEFGKPLIETRITSNIRKSRNGREVKETRNGRERALAGWLERPKRKNISPRSGHYTGKELCHFAINLNGAERLVEVAPHRIVKPEFITSLTASQLKLFIETSIKGDGWQRLGREGKQAGQSLNQSKRVRLEPFQTACAIAGIRTYLHEGIDRSYVSLFKRPNFQIGKAHQTPITYEGLIWCPTTPNGTWFARRKGTVYFTGNSANPAALFLARVKLPLPPGAPSGMRYGDIVSFREYLPGVGMSTAVNVDTFNQFTKGLTVQASAGGSHQEEDSRGVYTKHGWTIQEPAMSQVRPQVDRVVAIMEAGKYWVFEDNVFELAELASCAWKYDKDGNKTNEIDGEARFHLSACRRYILSLSEFTPETVYNSGKSRVRLSI